MVITVVNCRLVEDIDIGYYHSKGFSYPLDQSAKFVKVKGLKRDKLPLHLTIRGKKFPNILLERKLPITPTPSPTPSPFSTPIRSSRPPSTFSYSTPIPVKCSTPNQTPIPNLTKEVNMNFVQEQGNLFSPPIFLTK